MTDSDQLQSEISMLKAISSFNYVLRVHNMIGKIVTKDGSFSEDALSVSDFGSYYKSTGAWEKKDCRTGRLSIIYDIDFLRSIYQNDKYRSVVLAVWSLVGHEWGHISQDLEGKLFKDVPTEEEDANRIMERLMIDHGFRESEIVESYDLYYSTFKSLKSRETNDDIRREGKGTKTDFDSCDYKERLKEKK